MRDSLVGDGARAPGHPHDPVSFLKQKLCEVGPVLTVIPVINAVFPMHPSIGGRRRAQVDWTISLDPSGLAGFLFVSRVIMADGIVGG